MKFAVYIFTYPFIWLLSKLPFRVLYAVSDVLFFLVFYIFRYRKKVVLYNLELSFPEKTKEEREKICKKFYKHFVDVFMEMIKSFTISEKEITKRYTYTNSDIFEDLHKNGKSTILFFGHYANWEWVITLISLIKYKGVAAYTKIRNPYFDKKIKQSRGRLGVILKPTNEIIPEVINNHHKNIQTLYGLLSDQSPSIRKTHYWGRFFNITVPVHTGTEMLAKKYDMNVVFMATKKIKRGHYQSTFTTITTDAKKYADYEITDIFLRNLEAQIIEQPEFYFWTHKRFKHKDKAPV